MKIFSIIFSFFILFISCLPCADIQECNEDGLLTIAAAANHENHQHSSEGCTPFCSCACCAASVVFQPENKNQAAKIFVAIIKFPSLKEFFFSQDFSSIWQPPKIG